MKCTHKKNDGIVILKLEFEKLKGMTTSGGGWMNLTNLFWIETCLKNKTVCLNLNLYFY